MPVDGLRRGWLRAAVLSRTARPLRRLLAPLVARWPFAVRVRIGAHGWLFVRLDSSIGRSILATGDFDPAVRRAIAARLRTGDAFVDVGANVGFYTLIAREVVGDAGAVLAFDVDPRPAGLLERTVRVNGWRNVRLLRAAVGDGRTRLELLPRADCGHTRVRSIPAGDPRPGLPSTTLDSQRELLGGRRLACLKIDVEGHELEVLRGAQQLLSENLPAVICEVRPEHRDAAVELMAGLGYSAMELAAAHDPTLVFEPVHPARPPL